MGQEWTPAEAEADGSTRVRQRIDNYITAGERRAALFPGKLWGHKTTTEHILGLQTDGFDSLTCFIDQTSGIKTIFILRDGRSCVRSKVARAGLTIDEAIRRWRYSVRVLLAMQQRLATFHLVKMEDLVRNPETTLQAICDFIGIPFLPVMLSAPSSTSLNPEYRRSGFDRSAVDVSMIHDEWVAKIEEDLIACGYPITGRHAGGQ